MKAVLLGSVGNVTSKVTEKFIEEGIDTVVVTRSEKNAKLIEACGANAAIGDADDVNFLETVFKGADFVFILTAIDYQDGNFKEKVKTQITGIINAILSSGVQNVCCLSGIGAEKKSSGLLDFQRITEELLEQHLNTLQHVSIVRAARFYDNILMFLPTIKKSNQMFSFFETERPLSFVDLRYLADTIYKLAVDPPTTKFHVELCETERLKLPEIATILSENLNTPRPIELVKISDDAAIQNLVDNGFNQDIAKGLVDSLGEKRNDSLHELIFQQKVPKTGYSFQKFASTELKNTYDNNN